MNKILYTFLCIAILFSCNKGKETLSETVYFGDYSYYKNIDTTDIVKIESHALDLNGDKIADSIVLENVKDLIGDPQLFTKMTLKLSNNKSYVVKNIQGALIPKDVGFSLPNKLKSDKLYLTQMGEDNYIIVWDYPYSVGSNLLTVYKLSKDKLSKLFEGNYYVSSIKHLDATEALEIIGRTSALTGYRKIDSLQGSIYLYQPHHVMKLEDGYYKEDTILTRGYNEEHYIFEGFKDNNFIHVLIPDNGSKPYRIELPDSVMSVVRGAG